MHRSLLIFARYNRVVNTQMLEVLKTLTAEQLNEERNVYFKSLIGLLNHILNSDRQWITTLAAYMEETKPIVERVPNFVVSDFMAVPFPQLEQFIPVRAAMDDSMVEFIEAIPSQKMDTYFEHVDWAGNKHRLRFGAALLHLFNHQTHHRGQISALLDQIGVEHDWSNLVFLLNQIDPPPEY